ncbi:hypothetical protein B0T26DRAFT_748184 [Lasiosphaeria miniovina]|uniref:Uncharacterized protein n=1 Tax=Lasiosphaeria miniovina TaxID=1954250 RepID=A0AA40B569_9PEZI|nr:uncharacterized protein B0T26DRAFT_748184 [Lasiosphaeria miniovina]KAK0727890.1 hypothetical protein B0T26DRAFT_748184 [Lasiosphaeria miniovina]
MRVQVVDACGQPTGVYAVLKVFDRHFGPGLRKRGKYTILHTVQDENNFMLSVPAEGFYEEASKGDRSSVFEAALHDDEYRWFRTETRAYDKLVSIKGEYVSNMYAHVCLDINSATVTNNYASSPEF